MLKRLAVPVFLSALLVFPIVTVADPVIYDNSAAAGTIGGVSHVAATHAIQYADDFLLPMSDAGWRVTDVHWQGFELDHGINQDAFRIIFYADNGGEPTGGGGTTTDPTPTAIAVRNVTAAVTNAGYAAPQEPINDYEADINPVELSGATRYWMAVQSLSDEGWAWMSDYTMGNSVLGATGFYSELFWTSASSVSVGEMVFQLTGSEIPAPGAVVLAMVGLPAVGWIKRRFA